MKRKQVRIWTIHFKDGTVGSCYGTYDGTVEIAEFKKDLYGGSYTIEPSGGNFNERLC